MSRIRELAFCAIAAVMLLCAPRADAAVVIVDCKFGDFQYFLTRGFYVENFPGSTIGTVTVWHRASTAGERTIVLTARVSTYDGTLIGNAQVTKTIGTTWEKTVFDFGNVTVSSGSRIAFSQAIIAGGAVNVFYDGGDDNCPNVTTTEDTAPPLSVDKRDSAGVIITGNQLSISSAINYHCPYGEEDGLGWPYVRGFYIVNYRGTTLDTVRIRHKSGVAGNRTFNLVARLSRYDDGPLVGVASITRNITTDWTESVFDFGNAPVPAGSVITFEHVLVAGTPGVNYDSGYGPCEYVAVTNASTTPLDTLVGDSVGIKVRGRIASTQAHWVVEYHHTVFDHYFMTGDADEIAGLDGGAFGGVFVRTGEQFLVRDGPVNGSLDVCRFFTTPGNFGTKSSHFYTADADECAVVKLNPDWIYEKLAFFIFPPVAGECNFAVKVYRMYNNGQTGAPNHRFTTSLAIYNDFTTNRGWTGEGLRFCAVANF